MARALPVLRRSMAESWRGLLGWSVGVFGTLVLYLPLFPSLASAELDRIIEQMPEELIAVLGYDEISTGAGYTEATFFGLIGFALFSIAAIGWGAELIGQAEESGRLELDLAHGISRVRYALESAASLAIRITILALVSAAMIWGLNGPSELDLSLDRLLGATAALAGVSLAAGTMALWVGALTGRRVWGVGAGAGLTLSGYAFNAIAAQSESWSALGYLSTYYWAFFQPPLREGVDPVGLVVLFGASAVFTLLAVLALGRRDVTG